MRRRNSIKELNGKLAERERAAPTTEKGRVIFAVGLGCFVLAYPIWLPGTRFASRQLRTLA